jgi:hypothetical protein
MFSPTLILEFYIEQLVSSLFYFFAVPPELSSDCTLRGKTILKGTGENYKRKRSK